MDDGIETCIECGCFCVLEGASLVWMRICENRKYVEGEIKVHSNAKISRLPSVRNL